MALKPADERAGQPGLDASRSCMDLTASSPDMQDAFVAIFPPPPVQGLGQVGGFKLYVEDRAGLGFEELYTQVQAALNKGRERPDAGRPVLELPGERAADRRARRSRARQDLRRGLTDVFETLQVYLGSLYVNDFNRFGRTYQVNVQAESPFRTPARADRAG